MGQKFDDNPILNSPYACPSKHWKLDEEGGPTGEIIPKRRGSTHLVPIPAARKRMQISDGVLDLEGETKENPIINSIRDLIDAWRQKPGEQWNVTYATKKLLTQWREGKTTPRPFFCQIEAAETLIWLNEVAPGTAKGRIILEDLKLANDEANPKLLRFAAKMATGAGKTAVMAMMIAYHTINKARQPASSRFSNNFLIITPGITIKDRLRVLLPSDPENYYKGRGLVPPEFSEDIKKARVVITNYHAFRPRETRPMSKGTREILKGNMEGDIVTTETEGQVLERVCKELMRSKDVVVINDEAHHCYRHKVETGGEDEETRPVTREERDEIKENAEAARLWINGIEALGRKTGLKCVYDLSATPFFLRGSGYPEGRLFPWVVSDFALMDAIECGIVKLPRVPIDDGTMTGDQMPMYRNIYKHVSRDLPKKGRSKQGAMSPDDLPSVLLGAIETLYSHYAKTYATWDERGIDVPPVFIIVCNNTSTSKLVYDYIAGYEMPGKEGVWKRGKFALFDNIGESGRPRARMHTLLIDSVQLDSGESMSGDFKKAAAREIDLFKQEYRQRFPDKDVNRLTDEDLLREVMNTVGKKGRLGEQIRCVVSVSMLSEGWDTNNVTHILGVRAFGTQLLCEQVVGRGLRRYSYDLIDEGAHAGHLPPEYADVFGVPFTFAKGTKVDQPMSPNPQYRVYALDERAHLAISFPNVRGYTIKIPEENIVTSFDKNSRLTITPEDAPPRTEQQGIIGKGEMLTLDDLKNHRINEVVFYLAGETAKLFADRNENNEIQPSVYRDLIPIVRHWIKDYLTCLGGAFPQYLLWKLIAVEAAERIYRACAPQTEQEQEIYIPVIDKFTPEGSSFSVDFLTTKTRRHETRADKCHVNLAVCDSDWELSFCRLLEDDPGVHAYVRNDGLGFEVPYIYRKRAHHYKPDFIALVNDGHGKGNLLNLVIEIKGIKDDKARAKADTMNRFWVPSVNNDGHWGRWAFVEIMDMQNARKKLAEFTSG